MTAASALAGCCLMACGDDASRPAPTGAEPSSPTEQTPAADELPSTLSDADAAFRLSIKGWAEELTGAKAQLNVTEGTHAVRLEITGTGLADVLLLDVNFDGVEGTMGLHQVELGLPPVKSGVPADAGVDSAVASLGGQPYHSQSGHVEVTLSPDGSIQGRFDVALALDPEVGPSGQIVFELTDEVRALSGTFAGHWDLYCQSHLPGHSDAFRKGGDFCDGIAFE